MNPYKAAEKKWKGFKVVGDDCWEERLREWSSALIDLAASGENGARQVDTIEISPGRSRPIYAFGGHDDTDKTHDGFFLIPDALDHDTQRFLATKCLTEYAEPPHTTNLHQLNQQVENIWQKSQDSSAGDSKAKDPMQSLHWAALGYHYDWTTRTYPAHVGSRIPDELQALGTKFAHAVGLDLTSEAALVNYYKPSSTMGGHQDNVEVTFDHPVISVSLGCSAIFLKGVAKILPVRHLDAFPLEKDGDAAESAIAKYVRVNRLNINVRQVFPATPSSVTKRQKVNDGD
ncbi:hypothetical protein DYB28_002396 [Aphanomyces astaci]|uniref:Alpha-ketoglutarate-dependent dioxygenase AlkB-like domain-containing protein n=1 Tax=Aphanomyces astaci TaxID=112090 RepID=A0A3L6VBH3_APHAT|nr:hypothetical protein DYB35_011208 [Aphanomyces astaci]RLO06202.1 hypothetical protein DYB28_002396 [Aphanomyces astaci]